MRRQIKVSNSEFSTIASSGPLVNGHSYDIVFIDECSTVDNAAMKDLLKRLRCRLLVLVGDVYQIRSIKFGNWFSLARYFLSSDVIYELNTPYRSKHSSMVDLWNAGYCPNVEKCKLFLLISKILMLSAFFL